MRLKIKDEIEWKLNFLDIQKYANLRKLFLHVSNPKLNFESASQICANFPFLFAVHFLLFVVQSKFCWRVKNVYANSRMIVVQFDL